jgi:CheY-like chemotaxis protein
LTITVEQSDNLPIALVDLSQLEMAMLNLTLNARDATDGRGNIEIRSEPFEMTQDHADMTHLPTGLYVKISFHDNGCGMAPDLSEKIFEPFFTSKAAGSGSGLGLSMVYGFVQQSNGAVFVDSTLGKGTTFSILLPSVELNTKKPLADPSGKKLRSIESPGAISPTSSGLVLLVDDDIDVRRTVRRKIAGLGYPVVEAGDADEALNLIRQIKDISIVISDIGMPGTMDGIGLAHILKSQFDEIKVILMSGNRSIQTEDELPSDVIFLKKPFEADELRSCLTATKVDDYDGAEDRMKIE